MIMQLGRTITQPGRGHWADVTWWCNVHKDYCISRAIRGYTTDVKHWAFIIIYYYLLVSINIYYYLLLFIIIYYYYLLLSIIINCYQLLSIIIYYYLLSFIIIYHYLSLQNIFSLLHPLVQSRIWTPRQTAPS